MKTPNEFIAEQKTESGIIIGVSGYASKGFDYTRQARLLFIALGEIREQKRKNIDLVITGGTRYGDVALANEIAVGLTIPRMAFVPRVGLHSLVEAPEHIPPVHYLCVVGDKFGDETPYVGSTPDLLFLIGGGENSEREIEAALAKREFLKSQGKEGNRVAVIDFVDNPWTSVTERYQRLAEAKKLPDGVSYLNTMHDLMSFLKTV